MHVLLSCVKRLLLGTTIICSASLNAATQQHSSAQKYIPLIALDKNGKAEALYTRPIATTYAAAAFLGVLGIALIAKEQEQAKGIHILEGHPKRWWHIFSFSHKALTLDSIIPELSPSPTAPELSKNEDPKHVQYQQKLTQLPTALRELLYHIYGQTLIGIKKHNACTDHASNADIDRTCIIKALRDRQPITDTELEQIAQNPNILRIATVFIDEAGVAIVQDAHEMERIAINSEKNSAALKHIPGSIRCKKGVVCVAGKRAVQDKTAAAPEQQSK